MDDATEGPLSAGPVPKTRAQELAEEDAKLDVLNSLLRNTRLMAEDVGRELDLHNEMLSGISKDVDMVTERMERNTRAANSIR